ncbi:hypothetical protein [Citrobacter sp. Igbk 14]|uniref:hypothetical protein n=1 Tax=Citrobacter sp. Igbk 14 TaxID=2963960 RepID=UPI001076C5C4|nr:hypothetical protein [Citrobacter sp. Igbk 14]MDA8512862.1 hypothetical protein [Citrobacter sp. Igbk 14]
MEKLISNKGNVYKAVMLSTGEMRFYVRAGYSFHQLYTAPVIARITAAMLEADHTEALEMIAQHDADNSAGLEKMMKHLKMVAGPVIPAVKERITPETRDEEALAIVHEEILRWSESFTNFAKQHLLFNTEQRQKFAEIMYDLLAPAAQNVEITINPVYEKFAKQTGKSGAFNFICHQLPAEAISP